MVQCAVRWCSGAVCGAVVQCVVQCRAMHGAVQCASASSGALYPPRALHTGGFPGRHWNSQEFLRNSFSWNSFGKFPRPPLAVRVLPNGHWPELLERPAACLVPGGLQTLPDRDTNRRAYSGSVLPYVVPLCMYDAEGGRDKSCAGHQALSRPSKCISATQVPFKFMWAVLGRLRHKLRPTYPLLSANVYSHRGYRPFHS